MSNNTPQRNNPARDIREHTHVNPRSPSPPPKAPPPPPNKK